ncbi:MAG: hypothetical protein P0Y55_11695 [Candidatus Cohnella colombiensis]|uniref:Yip1 domain-containing protein n=1 Tax=Candidatus Cohnella colombiensis TaxID=3121368 RepID=A0AA95EV01_9BACL|nr:MAG: hypothetical protein P0Y55_11695 [Cohnella sp.]
MSDTTPNLDNTVDHQEYTQASPVSAPAVAPVTATTPSPLANFDVKRLVGLLTNPFSSTKLHSATEWIYSAISSAVGVLGFFFFVWALRKEIGAGDVGGVNDISDLFSGLANAIRSVSSPFYMPFGFVTPGKFLVLSVLSLAAIIAALTLIGNWVGGRKRAWLENATVFGGTQLLFGACYIVAGVIAFINFELATVIGVAIAVFSLLILALQALELHEVGVERRFSFLYMSVGGYAIAMYILYKIFT